MIARALNPGDVVHLRAGGVWMTVESTDGTRVVCIWMNPIDGQDGDGKAIFDPTIYRATFNEVTLQHIDDMNDEDEESE